MSKKSVFFIIIVILLILAGILAFVYLYFTQGATPGPEKNSGSRNLFPFGQGQNPTPGSTASTTEGANAHGGGEAANVSGPVPNLRQLSIVPVAGGIAFSNATTTYFRYTERGTGHIYEARSDTLTQIRLSNVTVPKVVEAFWINNLSFIIRYINNETGSIESFFGRIVPVKNTATSTQFADLVSTTVDGKFLPQNINEITVSPKKDAIFYTQTTNGEMSGIIASPDGSKKTLVFRNAFRDWLVQWPGERTVVLTSKAAASSFGYSYSLDTKTGTLKKVLGDIHGLTTLASSEATSIVYSENSRDDLLTILYRPKTQYKETLLLKTLPEKCVWGNLIKTDLYCAVPTFTPRATLPDDWYKGRISLSDDIWKIDTKTGELAELVALKKEAGMDIDAIKLSLDEKDTYLIFTNKTDLTLWSLKLPR